MLLHCARQHRVSLEDALLQRIDRLFDAFVFGIGEGNSLRSDRRCDITTCVTTHAISDKKQLIARVTRVLVRAAVLANVTGGIANGLDSQGLGPQLKVGGANTNGHPCPDSLRGGDFFAV